MLDDDVTVPRAVLHRLMQAVAGMSPRDAVATVSTVVGQLLFSAPVPRVARAGTAAEGSVVAATVAAHDLSVEDVAARTGASMRSVRRAAERGTLRGVQPDGEGTPWWFSEAAADEWLERYVTQAVRARRHRAGPVDPVRDERARLAVLDVEAEAALAALLAAENALRELNDETDPDAQPDPQREAQQQAAQARATFDALAPERNGLAALMHLQDSMLHSINQEQAGITALEVQAGALLEVDHAIDACAAAIAKSREIAPYEHTAALLHDMARLRGSRAYFAACTDRDDLPARRVRLAGLRESAATPPQPVTVDRALHTYRVRSHYRARYTAGEDGLDEYDEAVRAVVVGGQLDFVAGAVITLPGFVADWVCRDGGDVLELLDDQREAATTVDTREGQ